MIPNGSVAVGHPLPLCPVAHRGGVPWCGVVWVWWSAQSALAGPVRGRTLARVRGYAVARVCSSWSVPKPRGGETPAPFRACASGAGH